MVVIGVKTIKITEPCLGGGCVKDKIIKAAEDYRQKYRLDADHAVAFDARAEYGFKLAIEMLRSEECLRHEFELGWGHELSCKSLADWLENKFKGGIDKADS